MSRRRAKASCPSLFERIYRVVGRVPCGQVANYGLIAHLAGDGATPRLVGYAMAACPAGQGIPWQRIVNAQGRISLPGEAGERQRLILEAEGITFDADGRIEWRRFGWRPHRRGEKPPSSRAAKAKSRR